MKQIKNIFITTIFLQKNFFYSNFAGSQKKFKKYLYGSEDLTQAVY